MATENTHKRKRGVNIRVAHGPAVITEADARAVEDLLARLAARRFARENPALFGAKAEIADSRVTSGPPAAGAPVAGAPPANAGGPEEMELEHDADGSIGDAE